jgi:hypothetical protein
MIDCCLQLGDIFGILLIWEAKKLVHVFHFSYLQCCSLELNNVRKIIRLYFLSPMQIIN